MMMLDLCSGFGGASAAMREAGWTVIRVDHEPRVQPDIVADVRALPLRPFPVDLLWCSPTCTQYSRYDQPSLFPGEPPPDLSLWRRCREIIGEWQPRFWIVENVRGAQRWWGRADFHVGATYLWTNLPLFPEVIIRDRRHKHNLCSGTDPLRSARRGYIPLPISRAVRDTVVAFS